MLYMKEMGIHDVGELSLNRSTFDQSTKEIFMKYEMKRMEKKRDNL